MLVRGYSFVCRDRYGVIAGSTRGRRWVDHSNVNNTHKVCANEKRSIIELPW